MNNDELKKKIADIIYHTGCTGACCECDYSKHSDADTYCKAMLKASALIAAGIGDVKEAETENAALRERLEKSVELPFIVIDKKTGKEADEYNISLHEDWAKHLMYCDMEGFAIEQDGTIILLDECGQFVYCSSDRFEVVSEARLAELKGEER